MLLEAAKCIQTDKNLYCKGESYRFSGYAPCKCNKCIQISPTDPRSPCARAYHLVHLQFFVCKSQPIHYNHSKFSEAYLEINYNSIRSFEQLYDQQSNCINLFDIG